MQDTHAFLGNLALVLGVAALTTIVFQRLRQPLVFGYMLAGLIIGPHVPIPLVADVHTVHTLSELGVILLMFSLGLEISLRRLLQSGWSIVIIAVLQTSFMLWLGFVAGRLFGWSVMESLFAGAAISISSTTIIVKAFADEGVKGHVMRLVYGVLIVQDLIAILLLALLTPVTSGHGAAPAAIGITVVRLVGFLVGLLAIGMLVVPRLVRMVVRLQRNETILVTCIALCFGCALLARSIGYSVALGAFLAGALVAESGEDKRIVPLIEPVRDMFVAIFFVSVGMMIEPRLVAQHWSAVLVFTLLVLFGMTGAVTVSAFLTGTGIRTAVRTGMSLAQVGEFSFIIASVGLASGAASPALYPIIVAVSAITTLTTPWMIRAAGPIAAALDRNLPRPLQTFVALYGSWIESLNNRPETSADRERIRRALRGLAIDALVVVALSVAASVAAAPLGAQLAQRLGMPETRAQALVVAGAVALSVPFLFAIVNTGRALGQAMSRRAFPDPEPQRLDLAAAPRRALVVTIQLATVLVVGAPIVAITQPFLPPFAAVVLFVATLAILGVIVWRSAADLHGHVRAAAEAMVDALGKYSRASGVADVESTLERAYRVLPGLGEPIPVRIEEHGPAVGRRLADLELRGRTGATIVAISRGEDVVLVPDGHEVLAAGDVIALAGTHEAIEAARLLLAGMAQEG